MKYNESNIYRKLVGEKEEMQSFINNKWNEGMDENETKCEYNVNIRVRR